MIDATMTEVFQGFGGESHFAQARDGTRIHYWSFGSGRRTIAISDGLACDGFNWRYFPQAFQNDFRILLVNYRGHGLSDEPHDLRTLTVEQLADDFAAVLDDAGARNAIVAGYSMGVQVALEFTHRFPKRVKALLLICGSYQYPIDTFHDTSTLKQTFPLMYYMCTRYPALLRPFWKVGSTSPVLLHAAHLFETNPRLLALRDLRPYFSHIARLDPDLFARMLNFASQHSAEPYLRDIKTPALIVAGERDGFTPVWVSRLMQERLQDAELLVVRSGTHTAYLEQPLLVNLQIERFLRSRGLLTKPIPCTELDRREGPAPAATVHQRSTRIQVAEKREEPR